jgi:hypothetical protein
MASKLMLTVLFITLSFSTKVLAQSITFDYDDSGNCKLKYKTVVMARAQAKPINQKDQNPSDSTKNQISDFGDRKITLYPNPTKGVLTIEFAGEPFESGAEYRLTDLSGKLLMHGKFDYMWLSLDLSKLLPGTYMLHIQMDGKQDVWKILKE